MKRCRILTVTLVLAAAAAGCGGMRQAAERARAVNDLKQLGLLYQQYNDMNRKGPDRVEDLEPLADPQSRPVLQAVKAGKYVLIWGVKAGDLGKVPGGSGAAVLGYEKDVPSAGGPVLFGDMSVKVVTADEFKAAPRAK